MAKKNETRVAFIDPKDGESVVYPEKRYDKMVEGIKAANVAGAAAAQANNGTFEEAVVPEIQKSATFAFSDIDPDVDFLNKSEDEKWTVAYDLAKQLSATPENFASLFSRGAILIQQKESMDLLSDPEWNPPEDGSVVDLSYAISETRQRRKADPVAKSVMTLVEAFKSDKMTPEQLEMLRNLLAGAAGAAA